MTNLNTKIKTTFAIFCDVVFDLFCSQPDSFDENDALKNMCCTVLNVTLK